MFNIKQLLIFLFIFISFNVIVLIAKNIEVTEHSDNIKVIDYNLPAGLFTFGDSIIADVKFINLFNDKQEYWLGYSFKNHKNKWYDVPAKQIILQHNEKVSLNHIWCVPDNAETGKYDVNLSLWDSEPSQTANRLFTIIKKEAFKIKKITTFDGIEIVISEHSLGRGRFKVENVKITDDVLILKSEKNCFNAAEIQTTEKFGFGSYRAKIKSDSAHGSFTALFLYQDIEDNNDEIDIEIHNDGSRRIDLVTFKNGKKTNFIQKKLDFDPSSNYFEYRIDYFSDSIAFYADKTLLYEFNNDLPDSKMKLMINHWFPNWLDAEKKHSESKVYIRNIEIQ
jgi:hypothetical protein